MSSIRNAKCEVNQTSSTQVEFQIKEGEGVPLVGGSSLQVQQLKARHAAARFEGSRDDGMGVAEMRLELDH